MDRTVTGLADVYTESPWEDDIRSDFKCPMFKLHTNCSLRANEHFMGQQSTGFHICWMEYEQKAATEAQVVHEAWARYPLQEALERTEETIGTVCGSVRASFDPAILGKLLKHLQVGSFETPPWPWGLPDQKWWTVLVLAPKNAPQALSTVGSYIHKDTNLWVVMLYHIHRFVKMATRSWVEIEESFERLLAGSLTEKLVAEDKEFSQSHKLFWLINKIDGIVPMIADAITQWEWYLDVNGLDSKFDALRQILFFGEVREGADLHEYQRQETIKKFNKKVAAVEVLMKRLRNSQRRFEAMRDRARSLRDGVNSDALPETS